MNKYIKIIISILVITTIFILAIFVLSSSKNNKTIHKEEMANEELFKLNDITSTNENIEIIESDTKYANISVYTHEEWKNDKRSLLHASYPVTENKNINSELKNIAQLFIDEYKVIAKKQEQAYQDYFRETGEIAVSSIAEYLQHFDVSFVSNKYLLFIFDQYRNTGGTGSDTSFSVLFDRESGQKLDLADIFSDKNYLATLSSKSRAVLFNRMQDELNSLEIETKEQEEEWLSMRKEIINEGTEPLKNNFDSLSISEEKELLITFDKYQVAPGYLGTVSVKIPLTEIYDIINPEMIDIFDVDKQNYQSNKKDNTELNVGPNIDCAKEKCVALTFDDGPSLYTEKLLDILQEKDVKASFFVLGRSAKIQTNTIRRMVKEGHQIGNHSWDHKDLTKLSREAAQEQISKTDELIKDIANYNVTILRPPYGAYNKDMKEYINKSIILWNIDPEDWKDRNSDIILERMNKAEAGSIILAHDIYPSTVEAIPGLIDNLKQKGLNFVTIQDLFAPENLQETKAIKFQRS